MIAFLKNSQIQTFKSHVVRTTKHRSRLITYSYIKRGELEKEVFQK